MDHPIYWSPKRFAFQFPINTTSKPIAIFLEIKLRNWVKIVVPQNDLVSLLHGSQLFIRAAFSICV